MTRSADISLMEEGLVLIERFEPRFIALEGAAGNESIDCFLSMESPQVISGTWQRDIECVRLLGECGDFLCTDMELVVTEGELKGHTLSLSKKGKTYSVRVNGADQPMNGTVTVVRDVPLEVRSNANYRYLIDMAYPKIERGDFEKWLSGKLNNWYENIISVVSTDPEVGASNRWKFSASAWVDIYLFEDDLLSGVITMFDAAGNGYKREAFIYDLRNASEIPLYEFDKLRGGLLRKLQSNITASELKDSRGNTL